MFTFTLWGVIWKTIRLGSISKGADLYLMEAPERRFFANNRG